MSKKQLDEFNRIVLTDQEKFEVDEDILKELYSLVKTFEKYKDPESMAKNTGTTVDRVKQVLATKKIDGPEFTEFVLLFSGDKNYYERVAPKLTKTIPFVYEKIASSPSSLLALYNQYLELYKTGDIVKAERDFSTAMMPKNRK